MTIHTGAVEPLHHLEEVPPERWKVLTTARRGFVQSHIPYDCRALVRFVADAERLWQPLGYASAHDYIRDGLGIEPEDADTAIAGLEALGVDTTPLDVKTKPLDRVLRAYRRLSEEDRARFREALKGDG